MANYAAYYNTQESSELFVLAALATLNLCFFVHPLSINQWHWLALGC